MESQANKGDATQKLLNKKENTIQLLKKNLNIPSTQLIWASDLTKLEKEKETLTSELNDCKEKLLKFAKEKKQWERDMSLLVESEKTLKDKYMMNWRRICKKKKRNLKVK